jgi:hypothetical protein
MLRAVTVYMIGGVLAVAEITGENSGSQGMAIDTLHKFRPFIFAEAIAAMGWEDTLLQRQLSCAVEQHSTTGNQPEAVGEP